MKKRKCLPYLFSGILLFTLILTTCSGHFSIGASVLDTEPSTSVPTEISSEAPTEVPSGLPDNPQETVFPQKPKPIPQGLITILIVAYGSPSLVRESSKIPLI